MSEYLAAGLHWWRGAVALATITSLLGSALPAAAQQTSPRLRVAGNAFVAVIVEDLDTSVAWYERVFGAVEVNRFDNADRGVEVRLLSGQGLVVELLRLRDSAAVADRSHGLFKSGFHVDDLDAAYGWLRQHEVETVGEIFTDDALGARSVVFRDPEGNRLQLFEALSRDAEPDAATALRTDVSDIEALFEVDFAAAWRNRDVDAVAAIWAEDGDWSNVIGSRRIVAGRDQVRGVWDVGLGDRATSAELGIDVDVSHVRLLGPDHALADVLMHFAPSTDASLREAFVMVLARGAAGWRIVSARAARVPEDR
ncbi:MAG: SgcJ/EcaC family oxidoreductase [Acidobacteria bacterium]|nr:SgcJ/EcaC family oxidoreductase [Acidobacteriota bacterium]